MASDAKPNNDLASQIAELENQLKAVPQPLTPSEVVGGFNELAAEAKILRECLRKFQVRDQKV